MISSCLCNFAVILERCVLYKQLGALLILFAFLTQTFSRTFILVDYYTNTEAYAKNCENKDKPVMHCNGKCQMMKKITAQEKKDQQNPERKVQNEIALSAKSYFAKVSSVETPVSRIVYPTLAGGEEVRMPHTIFHPPTV